MALFDYIFNFSGSICAPPTGNLPECREAPPPGTPPPPFIHPFSVNFMVLSPKLTYTPGGSFGTGTLNAFDVNVVINGVTVEHDGTGTFGFSGALEFGGHGSSLDSVGLFASSPTISWIGSLNFDLGPTNDALNGASFSWRSPVPGGISASCSSSFVPNPSGHLDFCEVGGFSVVPEPGTAALAILGAAMLVACTVLEKRHFWRAARR
jgi:hypothetical protein